MKWICCQLGAREYYAIPRALFCVGALKYLITDAWIPPRSVLPRIVGQNSNLAERFHHELSDAPVKSFNTSLILFETLARAHRLGMWPRIIARNRWFQRKVVSALRDYPTTGQQDNGHGGNSVVSGQSSSGPLIVFAYSYAARDVFRFAKSRGWRTVLGQIDPGPEEERIVAEEAACVPQLARGWQPAPPEYWELWREECKLADGIVVNSEWSREGLMREGIRSEKLSVSPLAYETPKNANQKSEIRNRKSHRSYPARFTNDRPLRVLFLGLINLRKGVARLLEAARILRDEPVEFWLVGPVEIANASTVVEVGCLKWFGPATRKQAAEFYRNADVFLLPTLSDGFAITQLEAQAHGLPIIVSKNCGKVVENGVNGFILEEPTANCIAATIRNCIANPGQLEKLASASGVHDKFTIEALADQLQRLGATL